MTDIALTGGIASGKSTVAARLAELGAVVLDADAVARAALAPGSPGARAVITAFGEHILDEAGNIDRAALGRLVFADAAARATLNGIVHPEVRRSMSAARDAALVADPAAVIVQDIPLLVETGRAAEGWDAVWVTEAPVEVRVQRLVTLRGMRKEDARQRIAAQASDAERRRVATAVIDTSGEMADTLRQTDALWREITA